MSEWRTEAKRINEGLHELAGEPPCDTACTHFVAPRWSLLGLANVAARTIVGEGTEQETE